MPNDDARAAVEAARDLDRERERELVGEDQRLGARVDAVLPVVRDQRSPQSNGSPESWRTPSKSLQKYMSKSRRKASMP